jgi:alkylation response protein AidB-like acyl-CoA dehydrogenase
VTVYEWSDTDIIMRDTVREFIAKEIRPHLDDLETGAISPYPFARKLFSEFGLDVMAAEAVKTMLDKQRTRQASETASERSSRTGGLGEIGAQASMAAVLVSEIAGVSIGLLSTIGVSLGLGAATIMSRGTLAQKERWLPELMTLEKIAAWAITEPDSGSDAFGGMKTYVKRDGADYLLNGQKTFITNGPDADVIVVYAKLIDDSGTDARQRPVLTFVLDAGMAGLTQGRPFKKMGMMSSPTGELFFDNVRVGKDRLEARAELHQRFSDRRERLLRLASGLDQFAKVGLVQIAGGGFEEFRVIPLDRLADETDKVLRQAVVVIPDVGNRIDHLVFSRVGLLLGHRLLRKAGVSSGVGHSRPCIAGKHPSEMPPLGRAPDV